jgi:hypothetical protein
MEGTPTYSRASIKTISTAPSTTGNGGSSTASNKGFYFGLFIMLMLLGLACWLAWYFWPVPVTALPAGSTGSSTASIGGSWSAYNAQGVKAGYDWKITQTGSTLEVVDANMPTNKSSGTVTGTTVALPDFKLTGTLASDLKRINWTDGTYWIQN